MVGDSHSGPRQRPKGLQSLHVAWWQDLQGSLPWFLLTVMEKFYTDTLKLERPRLIPLPPNRLLPKGTRGANALMYQVKQNSTGRFNAFNLSSTSAMRPASASSCLLGCRSRLCCGQALTMCASEDTPCSRSSVNALCG